MKGYLLLPGILAFGWLLGAGVSYLTWRDWLGRGHPLNRQMRRHMGMAGAVLALVLLLAGCWP